MPLNLAVMLIILSQFVACGSLPPQAPPSKPKTDEIQVTKSELSEYISKAIRSEIMPEIREIQIGSKRAFRRSQKKIKKNIRQKTVIGRVEWISLAADQIDFRARIDTGAQTCSLHATDIVEKTEDGNKYVEFTTLDENNKQHRLIKKVVETTRVRSTSGRSESRYVVQMNLVFGERELKVNANLNDRSNLRHRFLVGRNLLIGDYIVDVSQSRLLGDKK